MISAFDCSLQVTIVGVIRSTDKSMTNIQYKVDDMTGAPMDVKQWVDTEVSGYSAAGLIFHLRAV